MAIGIYASVYLLSKLKQRLPLARRVDFLRFKDGLLVVRSASKLTQRDTLVKLKTGLGAMTAQVEVESYCGREEVYRLRVLDYELLQTNFGGEQREAARLPLKLEVRSKMLGSESFSTEDISETGARLALPDLVAPGTILDLELKLGDDLLKVAADVSWSAAKIDGSFHGGVHFRIQTQAQSHALQEYLGRVPAADS